MSEEVKTFQEDLNELLTKFERWVLSEEDIFSFSHGLSEANKAMATEAVRDHSPKQIMLMFLQQEALLLTLAKHKDAPYYSFRKYFLDNLNMVYCKAMEIANDASISD